MEQPTALGGWDSASVGDQARSLTWERLLLLAAVVQCVALLAVAAVLVDLEAAVVGVGFAVGVGLLRFRSGLLGRALLALAAANVLVWMALATVSILTGGDGARAMLIPAALTVLSLTTLAAALGTTITRRRSATATLGPVTAAAAAAGLLAVLLVGGALTGGGSGRAAQAGDLALSTANLAFTETDLVADAGQVSVVVDNQDLFWHTFTIDELGVDLPVSVNSTRTTTFEAEPGVYTYYCRIPGHESVMRGTLTVR